jgi:hypothetical protein
MRQPHWAERESLIKRRDTGCNHRVSQSLQCQTRNKPTQAVKAE